MDRHTGGSGYSMTPNATGTINCKAWNSPAEYPSWVARCDIKRSDGTMLNTIFWEKVQGLKILGVERLQNTKYLVSKCYLKQIPKVTSILVLNYLSESKTQLVHQRKQKVAFNPGTTNSPEIQSYRMWWGAASPILNDTPVVCIYTSYNRTHVKNHIYTYIFTQSFWTRTKVIRRKYIIQPTGFGACFSTFCQWDGENVPAPWKPSNSHPPVRVQNSYVNQFI